MAKRIKVINVKKKLTPTERLFHAYFLYISSEHGLSDKELAIALDCRRSTANRIRNFLASNEVTPHRFTLEPSEFDDKLAHAILRRLRLIAADKR